MEGNGGGIRREIDRKASEKCPSCGANDWVVEEGAEVVVLRLIRGGTDAGMDVLAYICGNCGFLRLHSAEVLRGDV